MSRKPTPVVDPPVLSVKDPPDLSVKDVAEDHGVSTKTVRNWIAAGVIPAYQIGGHLIRMRRSEVEAALKPVRDAI